MSSVPIYTFNNGLRVPALGLGCWMGEPGRGEVTEPMVTAALKHGYRHLDTAMQYKNEEAVGRAIRASGIPREEIFVTTKFFRQANVDLKTVLESSLKSLGLEYIDLWLIHWPMCLKDDQIISPEESPTFVETWKEMEEVYKKGKVKSIGVSNFSIKNLDILLKVAKIIPVTNQVELHPAYPQTDLLEYCKKKTILVTAYCPLGQYNSPFFKDPVLQDIAAKEGGTVAQVLISWGVQRGTVVIAKSEKEDRIRENIQILSLGDASMGAVDDWHKGPGVHRPLSRIMSAVRGEVFGWTYEQLGWNVKWDDEKKDVYVV